MLIVTIVIDIKTIIAALTKIITQMNDDKHHNISIHSAIDKKTVAVMIMRRYGNNNT
jgi:hypothetical protein